MNRKKFIVYLLAVMAICAGIIAAQSINNRLSKEKTYNDIFDLPTIAERKELYTKLTPTQKAEIWRGDLLVKMKVREYEGTEKEKIVRDLAETLFPDLFDTEKTGGGPQDGEFAETPEAKRFFEAMEHFKNTFSPEESKLFCGILGEPTDPAAEKAAKDKALVDDASSTLGEDCTWCDNYCQKNGSCVRVDSCGCFWFFKCDGICP